jgi:hypothetical protein
MIISVALTGVCARCNPPPPERSVAVKREPAPRPMAFDIPLLIGNPVIGLRGSEIPNNSPPMKVAA